MTTIINGDSNINLDFSTGGRITGDFSNATQANRALFQTSTVNANTAVGIIPNGTATASNLNVFVASDPTNCSFGQLRAEAASDIRLSSGATGSGSYVPMTFYTGGSESLRLSQTSKAVILSGGLTTANGTGITFPATQSASTDANTLDDYEEGSWTPTFNSSGATFTYATQFGTYIKIGRFVYAQFYLNATAAGTTSNFISLSNLPFPPTGASSFDQSGVAAWCTASVGVIQPLTDPNTNTALLWRQGVAPTAATAANLSGQYFVGTATYRTAS